jgi:hypothetical protein
MGFCPFCVLCASLRPQKLGIPVALASAPEHLYLKFRGDNGQWYGVEATNGGGWADDEVQRKNFPSITTESIANGVYLQPLTRKEAAVATIDSLLEHYQAQNTDDADEARIKLALLLVEHYPKDMGGDRQRLSWLQGPAAAAVHRQVPAAVRYPCASATALRTVE